MADDQQQQDKTEQPTPRRREEARKKGDVPRSRELTMAAVMMAGSAAILLMAESGGQSIVELVRNAFIIERVEALDSRLLMVVFADSLQSAASALTPLAVTVVVAAFLGAASIGGWAFSIQAAAFKGQRINPVKGFKRIFSANSLVELIKALAKFALVLLIAVVWLWYSLDDLLLLGRESVKSGILGAMRISALSLLIVSSGLILIAAIDVPFQLWNHSKKLRMTRREIREEFKETEGRPEVKSRIRLLQQQAATRRMMEDVPDADVVIVNPIHFAVALKYDMNKQGAPRVVAKGREHVAARIRDLAKMHNVPLFSAPPLARALYRSTDIGQEIPGTLYTAVAQVLAYIYRIREGFRPGEAVPEKPVPEVDEYLYE